MSPSATDQLLRRALGLTLAGVSGVVLVIVAFVAREAWPALHELGPRAFFSGEGWQPTRPAPRASYDTSALWVGSAAASLLALCVAVPLGLGCALHARFFAPPWLARLQRRALELLAGLPSVLLGLWGLVALVPWVRRIAPPGPSLCAGALVLALMVLPTIALLSESALASVPTSTVQAAHALGLSRVSVALRVVVPAARGGVSSAVLLAGARALGETMAVVMVCGNVVQLPGSLFDPVRTLTANIALEMGYASELHRSSLFVSGLLLLLGAAVLALGAQLGLRSAGERDG